MTMPMVDVQRRHKEVFRVRFGEKGNDGRPVRLTDAIRVTSDNPDIIDAFVFVYGGERRQWNDTAWEAKLPTRELRVTLLPGQSVSQWWEHYKGQVCDRRCDGKTEQKSGKPCEEMRPACAADPAQRTANRNDCSPTTRVSVICPDVPVIGAGMFVCHGLIGAETLPQSVRAAQAALAKGLQVPAIVRVVEMVGQGTRFIVPTIEVVGISMYDMLEAAENPALAGGPGRILGGGAQPAIAAPIADGVPSVRDQINAIDAPAPANNRKNAAEPIPPTGQAPRTAAAAAQADVIDVGGEEDEDSSAVQLIPAADDGGGPGALHVASGTPTTNRVAIACREAGMDDDERHMLAAWASEGRTRSSKDLTDVEVGHALIAAANVRDGRARIREVDGDVRMLHATFGWPVPRGRELGDDDPESGSGDPSTVSGMPALSAAEIMAMKGQQVNEALRDRGLQLGGTVPDMKARLMDALGVAEEPF